MNKKSFLLLSKIVVPLVLIPFLAMQFTTQVNWSFADFVLAFFGLYGTGLVALFITYKVQTIRLRILLLLVLLIVFVLLWAELAVGIFDSCLAGS